MSHGENTRRRIAVRLRWLRRKIFQCRRDRKEIKNPLREAKKAHEYSQEQSSLAQDKKKHAVSAGVLLLTNTISDEARANRHQKHFEHRDKKCMEWRGLIVLSITGILIGLQAYIAQEGLNDARNTSAHQFQLMENEQRPWIGEALSVTDIGHLKENPPYLLQYVDLINSGKTPASIVDIQFAFGAFDILPADPEYSPNEATVIQGEAETNSPISVIPNGHYRTTLRQYIYNYAEVEPLLASGQSHMFLYGKVIYKDINEHEHHTHFCKVFFYPLESKHSRDCKNYNDGD